MPPGGRSAQARGKPREAAECLQPFYLSVFAQCAALKLPRFIAAETCAAAARRAVTAAGFAARATFGNAANDAAVIAFVRCRVAFKRRVAAHASVIFARCAPAACVGRIGAAAAPGVVSAARRATPLPVCASPLIGRVSDFFCLGFSAACARFPIDAICPDRTRNRAAFACVKSAGSDAFQHAVFAPIQIGRNIGSLIAANACAAVAAAAASAADIAASAIIVFAQNAFRFGIFGAGFVVLGAGRAVFGRVGTGRAGIAVLGFRRAGFGDRRRSDGALRRIILRNRFGRLVFIATAKRRAQSGNGNPFHRFVLHEFLRKRQSPSKMPTIIRNKPVHPE